MKVAAGLLSLLLCITLSGCSGSGDTEKDETIAPDESKKEILESEYDKGYNEGYDKGSNEGHDKGYEEGYNDGKEEGAQETASEVERKASLTIENPYYTIELPDEWYGTFEAVRDDSISGSSEDLQIGGSIAIMQNGYATFSVSCYTDAWGIQGDFYSTSLGAPSNLPGYHVVVAHAMFDADGNRVEDRSAEYAQYVTVK